MNAKTLEAVRKHGETLLALFPCCEEKDPVALCKKLCRIESAVSRPILDYTNGDGGVTLDMVDSATNCALIRLGNLLCADSKLIKFTGIFINRDPRGHAIKLEEEPTRTFNAGRYAARLPALCTDMGGYGIIAPDLTEK